MIVARDGNHMKVPGHQVYIKLAGFYKFIAVKVLN